MVDDNREYVLESVCEGDLCNHPSALPNKVKHKPVSYPNIKSVLYGLSEIDICKLLWYV